MRNARIGNMVREHMPLAVAVVELVTFAMEGYILEVRDALLRQVIVVRAFTSEADLTERREKLDYIEQVPASARAIHIE